MAHHERQQLRVSSGTFGKNAGVPTENNREEFHAKPEWRCRTHAKAKASVDSIACDGALYDRSARVAGRTCRESHGVAVSIAAANEIAVSGTVTLPVSSATAGADLGSDTDAASTLTWITNGASNETSAVGKSLGREYQ